MTMGPRDYQKARFYTGLNPGAHEVGISGKVAGSIYAIGEIQDAIPIIHGPAGCGFHYRYNCQRDYLPVYEARCSNLKERDLILGGAGKLRAAILDTVATAAPAMIVIVPSTSIDMVQADLDAVVGELRGKVPTRLVAIRSETFSHPDKRDRKGDAAHRVAHLMVPDPGGDAGLRGCGFGEAMKAMVDQVMEARPAQPRTVNLCSLAWGATGPALIDGMTRELAALDIGINAVLPHGRTRDIVAAPGAGLNLLCRRVAWARYMQGRFGTPYFALGAPHFWQGEAGIERLYRAIAGALGAEGRGLDALADRGAEATDGLRPDRAYLSGFRYALVSSDYRAIPFLVEKYERVFAMPLSHVCVAMAPEVLDAEGITPDLAGILVDAMRTALEKAGSRARLLINPGAATLQAMAAEVDFVIGGEELPFRPAEARFIRDARNQLPLDFAGLRMAVAHLAEGISALPRREYLITDRLRQPITQAGMTDPEGGTACARRPAGAPSRATGAPGCPDRPGPPSDETNRCGSMKMWDEMWTRRR